MRVAVASGKGGTGKTSLAVSCALAWKDAALVDCDVEGPNTHVLLAPEIESTEAVTVQVPKVNGERCQLSGTCAATCRFNALAVAGGQWLVFPELCHACGACVLACPHNALDEVPRQVGELKLGRSNGFPFLQGVLREGEAQPVPVIRAALSRLPDTRDVIIDASPGTACPMVAVVEACDVVLLVTEPTPFGRHDLADALEAVASIGRPAGVVINRADWGDSGVRELCRERGVPVLLEIPHLRSVAEAYARAVPLVTAAPQIAPELAALREQLRALAPEGG